MGSLVSCLKSGKLFPDLKVKCLLDISRGMLFLHESSLMHRDLKGENILMCSLDTTATVNCKITGISFWLILILILILDLILIHHFPFPFVFVCLFFVC